MCGQFVIGCNPWCFDMGGFVTQCGAVLGHLQSGKTLTPMEAYVLYGTLALHSRVAELRSRGHDIACKLVKVPSGKTVGEYSLRGQLSLAA